MKIWYDYYNNIGVVIATKRCNYLFHLQVHKIQISHQEQKNRIIYLMGGVSIDASSVAIVDIIVGRYFAIGLPTAH